MPDEAAVESSDVALGLAPSEEEAFGKASFNQLKKAVLASPHTDKGVVTWEGNTKYNDLALMTRGGGRRLVMDFARWGMKGGQPRFQVYDGRSGIMEEASGLLTATERGEVLGIKHPDAELIAAIFSYGRAAIQYVEYLEKRLAGDAQ